MKSCTLPYCLLAIFLCLFVAAKAQKISGTIIDAKTKLPLEFVAVSAGETGTISNAAGRFEIELGKTDKYLTFSLLGYVSKTIAVDKIKKEILVELIPRFSELSTVTITGNQKCGLIDKEDITVLDYTFLDSAIYVLSSYKSGKYLLYLFSSNLDTLGQVGLSNKPEELYTDCFGNSHIITSDSAYLLYFSGELIQLIYGISKEVFNAKIRPCIAASDENLFTETSYGARTVVMYAFRRTTNPRTLQYKAIDRKSGKQQLFPPIFLAETGLRLAKNEAYHDRLMVMKDMYPGETKFAKAVNREGDLNFGEQILIGKIYAPLFTQDTAPIIFNFSKDQIEFFSKSNSLIHTQLVNFHQVKNWKPTVFMDKMTNKFYTAFELNGINTLYEITTKTGDIQNKTTIQYPFCEKIKVNNSQVYFLYRNPGFRNVALGRIPVDVQ